MKSLYESALSGITSLLDKQINSYDDSKSAAVDSLEAERDARIEVIEAQKEQLEKQIDLIDKQIEAKEKKRCTFFVQLLKNLYIENSLIFLSIGLFCVCIFITHDVTINISDS